MNREAFIHCIPRWVLDGPDFATLVDHYMVVDEGVLRYQAKPFFDDMYTVLDRFDDDFVYLAKGRTKTKKIWRSPSVDEAITYAMQLNHDHAAVKLRDETSLTQRIAFINQRVPKKKLMKRVPFTRCECGTMYRGEKHCG